MATMTATPSRRSVERHARIRQPAVPLDELASNPVARAYVRDRPDRLATGAGDRIARALILGVVLPGLVFLASTPIGWILLLFGVLGAFAFSSALGM
jgi:hypothetical protein